MFIFSISLSKVFYTKTYKKFFSLKSTYIVWNSHDLNSHLHSLSLAWAPQHKVFINQNDLNWVFGFFESCGTFYLTNNNHSFYDLSSFFDYFLLNPGLFIHYFLNSKSPFFFNQNFISQLNFKTLKRFDQLHFFIYKKQNKFFLTNYCFYKFVNKSFCFHHIPRYSSFLESDHFFVLQENCLTVSLPDFLHKSHLKEWKLGFMVTHYDPQLIYKLRQILGFGTIKRYSFHTHTLSLLNLKTHNTLHYYKYVILDFNGLTRLFFFFLLNCFHYQLLFIKKKFFFFFQVFQILTNFSIFNSNFYFLCWHNYLVLKNDFSRFLKPHSFFSLNQVSYPSFQKNNVFFFLPFFAISSLSFSRSSFSPYLFFSFPNFLSFSNSWFSGFLDSLGCFNVSYYNQNVGLLHKRHCLNNIFNLNLFIYLYTEFFFFFFLNKFFFKNVGFFKFYLLHYFNLKSNFIFSSYLYQKFIFYIFLHSKFFEKNNFFFFVYFIKLDPLTVSYFYFNHSLPFCFFSSSNLFFSSFLCHFFKYNKIYLNKPFLELVIFSPLKENISFLHLFNLTMTLHFFPVLKEFKNNQSTKDSFLFLLKYLRVFPLKSKKNISFIRFSKILSRLNDNFTRKGRSLSRLGRLINSLHKLK